MKNTTLCGFALSLALPLTQAFADENGDLTAQTPADCDYVSLQAREIALPLSDYSLEMFAIRTGCLLILRDTGAVDPLIYKDTIRAFQTHMAGLAAAHPTITLRDNYAAPDGIIAEDFVRDFAVISYYEQYLGAFYAKDDFFYDPRSIESTYLKRFSRQLEVMNPSIFNEAQGALYESWDDVRVLEQDLRPLRTPANQSLTA